MNEPDLDEGTLALYVLHMLDRREEQRIEAASANDPVLRARIEEAQETLVSLALQQAQPPPVDLKRAILAAVEMDIQNDRKNERFPLLHDDIRLVDMVPLLDREDLVLPADAEDSHMIEVERTSDRETVLVWLRTVHPEEIHTDFVERILVLEGTCDIHLGNEVISMIPGEVITIPLHVPHSVRVTSAAWCKALVQRVAA